MKLRVLVLDKNFNHYSLLCLKYLFCVIFEQHVYCLEWGELSVKYVQEIANPWTTQVQTEQVHFTHIFLKY